MDPEQIMRLTAQQDVPEDDGREMIRGYKKWKGQTLYFANSDNLLNNLESIVFRPTDVILHTYPKCGTSFVGDVAVDIMLAAGRMEKRGLYPLDLGDFTDQINRAPQDVQRIFLVHLRWNALPKKLKTGKYKMLCMTRDPRDVLCSFYPFSKRQYIINEDMSMDTFLDLYITDKSAYGDYFEWHRQWMPHQSDANILSLRFKEMKADLRGAVVAIKDHLNIELSDEQLEEIVYKNQFEVKKSAREGLQGQHLRKGKTGAWREELTTEQIAKLDVWIAKGQVGLEELNLVDLN